MRLDDTVQRLAEQDAEAPEGALKAVDATCLYAVYDPVTRKCTMVTAGHPPPAIVDPRGQVTFPDLPTGTPLGIGVGVPFESVEPSLPRSRSAGTTDENGRGLLLVSQLSRRWGCRPIPGGKVVWAEVGPRA
ncbi:ATP-binding SpoIIE family protein phosphatase [Streptomyces sp. NPDC059861]|uniref:ATP-binding SpoIIE family protein phosphatase n=1 Tax=Streptomyces sp. NPDC059861 TaxID=3346974 RepID=UPI00365B5993